MPSPRALAPLLVASAAALLCGCDGSTGGATYQLSAQSATVDTRDDQGSCWEPGCTAPRTYVCVTLGGVKNCSTPRASTSPEWFEPLFAAVPAADLRRGLTVDYLHEAGATDGTICHQNVVLTDRILAAGRFDLPCGGNTVVTLGLRAN